MSTIQINIWGRNFNLPVYYACYEEESITQNQKDTFNSFIKDKPESLDEPSAIKKYCMQNNRAEMSEDEITNIFRYVIPVEIYVLRDSEKKLVALMCNYKFDMEHGIAMLFENEKLLKIGPQDMVL